MERLRRSELQALLAGVREVSVLRAAEAFPAAAIALARRVVPGVCHSYTAIDLHRGRTTIVVDPPEAMFPGGEEIFVRHAPEHPLIARFADAPEHPALTISDFLSQRAFHRLGLYTDVYRRIDTEDQLAIGLPAPEATAVGITVNRGRPGFSARERLLLDLARPHLAQAFRNAQFVTAMQQAFSASAHPTLVLRADDSVVRASEGAWELLAAYFEPRSSRRSLPDPVRRWARVQCQRLHNASGAPVPVAPLVAERAGRCLTIVLFMGPAPDGECLLLLHERPPQLTVELMAQLGLGRRECEVLLWVTRGKTNPEIAALLSISTRTVQKHLEHIYAKLGAAGRAAATARALACLQR